MNRTILVIGIIFLLIGASVVSSTDNIVDDTKIDYQPKESNIKSTEVLSCGNIAYAYIPSQGPCYFYLDDPGNLTSFDILNCPDYYRATWTNYGKMLVLDETNALWEIDLCDRTALKIGGGGVSLNDLSYNPMNDKLYGITSTDLYEIDIDTGNQTYIGNLGVSNTMIALVIDIDGNAYAWDVLFSGNSHLYSIDLETGKATEYCDMGQNLLLQQSGCFDWSTGILWLALHSSGGFLVYWDWDAQELVCVGELGGGIGALVIPDTDICLPVTTISFDPPEPDGCNGWYVSDVNVTLNATDDTGVNSTYYRINEGVWEIYESPFVLSEDGEDILIEFYSVDNDGYVEYVKSATLDIDKTPPDMIVEWEVEKVGWNKWEVTFYIEINDSTSGSDVDRLEIFLNDALQITLPGPGPFTWSCIISGGLSLSFKFIAVDLAGNQAVIVINDTDSSYHNQIRDIFNQQSINPFILRLLDRFPLLERLLDVWKWNII